MKTRSAIVLGLMLSACTHGTSTTAPDWVGRELRPPRKNLQVGALYFAREAPGNSGPVNLERLCDVDLAKYKITAVPQVVADIDLTRNLEATGALTGVKNYFFNAGISGNFQDYFEYKLTNVVETGISGTEAENIFAQRAFQQDCKGWRENVGGQNWAKMQILSVRSGDIVFKQKDNAGGSAEVNTKIGAAAPQLKTTLKRDYNLAMTGTGLVFAFSPLPRN